MLICLLANIKNDFQYFFIRNWMMGSFKGKPKRGIKCASVKRASYIERRKRSMYSPRPSPICKRFKSNHSMKSPDIKKTSVNKRRHLPTPSKASQKRIHFMIDTETDNVTISPLKSPFKKLLSQQQNTKSKVKNTDKVNITSDDKPTERLLEELGCTNILDENEFNKKLDHNNNDALPVGFKMPQEILEDLSAKIPKQIVDDLNTKFHLTDDEFQSDDINSEESKLANLLPAVIHEFKKNDKTDVLINFFQLVSENKFPMRNISFLMFCDLVRWFSETKIVIAI